MLEREAPAQSCTEKNKKTKKKSLEENQDEEVATRYE